MANYITKKLFPKDLFADLFSSFPEHTPAIQGRGGGDIVHDTVQPSFQEGATCRELSSVWVQGSILVNISEPTEEARSLRRHWEGHK